LGEPPLWGIEPPQWGVLGEPPRWGVLGEPPQWGVLGEPPHWGVCTYGVSRWGARACGTPGRRRNAAVVCAHRVGDIRRYAEGPTVTLARPTWLERDPAL